MYRRGKPGPRISSSSVARARVSWELSPIPSSSTIVCFFLKSSIPRNRIWMPQANLSIFTDLCLSASFRSVTMCSSLQTFSWFLWIFALCSLQFFPIEHHWVHFWFPWGTAQGFFWNQGPFSQPHLPNSILTSQEKPESSFRDRQYRESNLSFKAAMVASQV